jgi:hypothetical protein
MITVDTSIIKEAYDLSRESVVIPSYFSYNPYQEFIKAYRELTEPVVEVPTVKKTFRLKFSEFVFPPKPVPEKVYVPTNHVKQLARIYEMTVHEIENMITNFGENWDINFMGKDKKSFENRLNVLHNSSVYWLFAKGTDDPNWRNNLFSIIVEENNIEYDYIHYSTLLYIYNHFDEETYHNLKAMPSSLMHETLEPIIAEIEEDFQSTIEDRKLITNSQFNRSYKIKYTPVPYTYEDYSYNDSDSDSDSFEPKGYDKTSKPENVFRPIYFS